VGASEKPIKEMDQAGTEDAQDSRKFVNSDDVANVRNGGIRPDLLKAIEQTQEAHRVDGKPYGVKKPKGRVTAKQRQFASLVAQGHSPREAYRKAYNAAGSSEATVMINANRVMKVAKVAGIIESVWESVEKNIIDDQIAAKRFILEELHGHAINEKNRTGDRLKSLELMGKAIGMFTDKVETKVEQVDADQLKRELDSHLKTFKTMQ